MKSISEEDQVFSCFAIDLSRPIGKREGTKKTQNAAYWAEWRCMFTQLAFSVSTLSSSVDVN
jgi:hypothetical protein